jgi:uncharacterized protein YggE
LNEAAGAVDGVLARFGDAIEQVETTGVRLSPQLKAGRGADKLVGYVGVAQRVVTVVDFERLGELVSQLAGVDLAEVAGPWWSLRRDSPVRAQARLEAVQDAVRRARDYARALDADVSSLVEVADTGLLSHGGIISPGMAPVAARGLARGGSAPEELTFDLTPVKQNVRASVEARFRMTSPSLNAD